MNSFDLAEQTLLEISAIQRKQLKFKGNGLQTTQAKTKEK